MFFRASREDLGDVVSYEDELEELEMMNGLGRYFYTNDEFSRFKMRCLRLRKWLSEE
jgi:hypothetical protein